MDIDHQIKKKKNRNYNVGLSFGAIFMHADGWDMLLMSLGLFGSFGDGISMPVMLLVTSKIMNNFGNSKTSTAAEFTHSINKVCFLPPSSSSF